MIEYTLIMLGILTLLVIWRPLTNWKEFKQSVKENYEANINMIKYNREQRNKK